MKKIIVTVLLLITILPGIFCAVEKNSAADLNSEVKYGDNIALGKNKKRPITLGYAANDENGKSESERPAENRHYSYKDTNGDITMSMAEFRKYISQLEKMASDYKNNCSYETDSVTELVLQYLRKNSYGFLPEKEEGVKGLAWNLAAGEIDWLFAEYVIEQYKNNPNEIIVRNYARITVTDPVSENGIDMTHWATVLNTLVYNNSKNIGDLSGWAGDLQSMIRDVQKEINDSEGELDPEEYDDAYGVAKKFVGASGKGSFSMADMMADADAVNIRHMLDVGQSLSQAVSFYYGTTHPDRIEANAKERYTHFMKNQFGINDFVNEDNRNKIKDYVGKYTQKPSFGEQIIIEMNRDKSVKVTDAERNGMRDAFADFIIDKVKEHK